MTKPLFEALADPSLDKVRATYAQRGGEYADTLGNLNTLAMQATMKVLGIPAPSKDGLLALMLAAMVDVKYTRMLGGYKEDSVIDGIAYSAAWRTQMERLAKSSEKSEANGKPIYRSLGVGEEVEPDDEWRREDGIQWVRLGKVGVITDRSVGQYRRKVSQ